MIIPFFKVPLITNGSGSLMVTVNSFVPYAPVESVTLTVNLYVPAFLGVPEISPVDELMLNPHLRSNNNNSSSMFQVYGSIPPLAVKLHEYA